jgi:hypothetical protein
LTLLHSSYDEQILLARDEGNFDQKVWRAAQKMVSLPSFL